MGVEHFAYLPEQLAGLPAGAGTHSSAHTDLAAFAGQRVTVAGAGQFALESAALLHEHGAQVQIVMRKEKVVWNGTPLPPDRPLLQRLREPEAGLGSGWSTWFYSTRPGSFRHLPESTRVLRALYCARPGRGQLASRPRRGRVPGSHRPGAGLGGVRSRRGPARAGQWLRGPDPGGRRPRHRGHRVLAGPERPTSPGYAGLRSRPRTPCTPAVDRDYQTSAPGLYVVGPGVAPTFGPVMRFVYGADHAARTVGRRLAGEAPANRCYRGGLRACPRPSEPGPQARASGRCGFLWGMRTSWLAR